MQQSHSRFWIITALVFVALIWLLQSVLLPFVAGMVIAYFLAPVVDWLGKRNVPRWAGAILVLLGFGVVLGLVVTLILPVITSQVGALIKAMPDYVAKLRTHYNSLYEMMIDRLPQEDVEKVRDAAAQSASDAAGWLGNFLKHVVTSGFALIDALMLAVITPVVAFFFLRDWPSLTATLDSTLPRRYYDVIHVQLLEIDKSLSGFIRGQALVCLALGLIYSIGLTAIGLQYSVAIGVTAGILSFIPYVGTAFGWISALILATIQFNDFTHIGLVLGVFAFGHVMEAYVLAPRLIGNRVGLHPVWILFALIAGGKLMGFLGVLIAVPVAAVLGVLIRFMLRQYRASPLYKDLL